MPTSDPNSIWPSDTHFPVAIVFAILYSIPVTLQFYQTVIKYKSYYFIVVFVGACFEFFGYIVRGVSIKKPDEIPPYAVQSSLIVLAPLFVAAGNYLLISRLCVRVLPAYITHIHRIPLRFLTRIFVLCDIFTFLIQVSGSGIASSGDWQGSVVTIGLDVLMVGLGAQLFTIVFFLGVVGRFHVLSKAGNVRAEAREGWKKVLRAVYVSCCLIILRSIYRLIEFALGIQGYPFTHEWIFYVFESLPMLPAISVFCVWHPAEYLGGGWRKGKGVGDVQLENSSGGTNV